MKRSNRLIIMLLFLILSLGACSNLEQLGMTQFADAITNAINATNGNISTDIVLDTPTNNQNFTNYSFIATGFAISDVSINQVFVFVRPEGSVATPDTYVASILDSGSSLRPFTTAITVTLNTNYDVWAQVHDTSGNVINSSTIMISVDSSGAGPTYPEIAVYQNTTAITSGNTYTNDFGTLTKNTVSPAVTFTISNIGNASLSIATISDSSSQFSNTAVSGFNIGVGGSYQFDIFFTPTTAGTNNATITINNNDSDENPYYFIVKGIATNSSTPEPELHVYYAGIDISSGNSYTNDFGALLTNQTSASHNFILSNAGDASLDINSISDNSIHFSTGNVNTTITAGGFTSFNIEFTPTNAGNKYDTINIDTSFNSPFTYIVKGLGTNATTSPEPEISVYFNSTLIADGSSYTNDMGSWLTNQTSFTATFTISNTGSDTLYLSSIVDSSAQFATEDLNVGITIGNATTFDVTFNASTAGTYHNLITINNDDADEATYTFYTKGQATNATGGGQYTMTIDGIKDSDWNNTFIVSQSSTAADLDVTNFYVANDASNLYLAFNSDNPISTWDRNILVMYQIDDTPSAGTPMIGESHFSAGDTWSSSWNPTGGIFFKIANSESWKGTFAHKVNIGGTDWDNVIGGETGNHGISTDYMFVEGKFDLNSLGLSTGQTVKFYIVLTHQFNEYSSSSLPITYTPSGDEHVAKNHTPVTWTANYTIK